MILYYLRKHGESAGVIEQAEGIAAMENEIPVEDIESTHKRVYVSIYQTHLPKMADTHVIEYDKDQGSVRLTDQNSSIDQYLMTDGGPPYPWQVRYFALGTIGGGLLGLSFSELPASGAMASLWVGVGRFVLLVTFGIVRYRLVSGDTELPLELTHYDR